MNFISVFIFSVCIFSTEAHFFSSKLNTVYEWNQLTFAWPNETIKSESIASGAYIPENNEPLGIGFWKHKMFITVPRIKNGVAASVAYIDLNSGNGNTTSPDLNPYPDWESHNISKKSFKSIVSTLRLNIDSCDRLWFVDTGADNITDGQHIITIYNLTTDELIRKYKLKATDRTADTDVSSITIDVGDSCDDAYAYATDDAGHSIIVYSFKDNDSWKFTHNFLGPEPLAGNFFFHGLNFQFSDGVFSTALGPKDQNGYRTVYFHSYLGYNEFSVNTRTLKNKSLTRNNNYYLFKDEGFKGHNTNSLISVFDEKTNVLLLAQPNVDAIYCWNVKRSLTSRTFHEVVQDSSLLTFPSDIKVLAALRFYASGSYQEITGSNSFVAISQSSTSRVINEVTNALNRPEILNNVIRFPRNIEELQTIRTRFYENYQFPGIIGCIDCTHVSIVAPAANDEHFPEHVYVNRKNYHSLNVQLICDNDLKIMNVISRFPGSTHDAHIWRESAVSNLMEQLYRRDPGNVFFLLGDSGYPTRPWLLTPILNPQNVGQQRYNERLCSIRSIIERCNGVLKNRFRCLLRYRTLHYHPTTAGKIVNACCVLHNLCMERNIPEPHEPHIEEPDYGMYNYPNFIDNMPQIINADLAAGRNLQQNIIANHFND